MNLFGNVIVYLALAFPVPGGQQGRPVLPAPIGAILDQRYPGWHVAEVSREVRAAVGQRLGTTPGVIRGDFDGNGRADYAMLIEYRNTDDGGQPFTHFVEALAFLDNAGSSARVVGRTSTATGILGMSLRRTEAVMLAGATTALLAWGEVILAVQSQTVVPPAQTAATPGPPSDAEFYLRRGEDFSSAHDYDHAIADYTTAIQLKPNYAEAYNDRGFSYYLKGNAERAIADYTRAIELRPNYPKAYNSRGVAYMAHGYGAAKSIPDFDRAIALQPDFRYAYINRANARLASHPWLALQDFHRAGMYPEQTVAKLVGAVLIMIVGIVWIRRRRLRRASGAA